MKMILDVWINMRWNASISLLEGLIICQLELMLRIETLSLIHISFRKNIIWLHKRFLVAICCSSVHGCNQSKSNLSNIQDSSSSWVESVDNTLAICTWQMTALARITIFLADKFLKPTEILLEPGSKLQ